MANLVLASKRENKNGVNMWKVYRSDNNNKSDEFFFYSPLKALRYAFILRSRHGAIIPKAIYGKLMADVQASKVGNTTEQQPSTDSAPKKKATRKSNKKENK